MQASPRYRQSDRLERKRHGHVKAFFRRLGFLSMVISIPCVLIGSGYALFYSNLFTIQTIDIHASKSLDTELLRSLMYRQLDEMTLRILPQRNIFAFNTNEASRIISSRVLVTHLSLKRVFPHTIRVDVEGKEFELLWYSDNAVKKVGSDGTIVGVADQATIASLPLQLLRKNYGADILIVDQHIQKRVSSPILVVDAKQKKTEIGVSVIDKVILASLLLLGEQCRKAGFDMAYVVHDRDESSLTLVAKEGWEVYMSLRPDMEPQFKNLTTLLTHSIKKDRPRLKYIDVRFDNRLYYTFL